MNIDLKKVLLQLAVLKSKKKFKVELSSLCEIKYNISWTLGCFLLQEGMLSYEEAIVARQNLIKENQSKVAEIKEQVSKDVKGNNMKHEQPRMTSSS